MGGLDPSQTCDSYACALAQLVSYYLGLSDKLYIKGAVMIKYLDPVVGEAVGFFAVSGAPSPDTDVVIAEAALFAAGYSRVVGEVASAPEVPIFSSDWHVTAR